MVQAGERYKYLEEASKWSLSLGFVPVEEAMLEDFASQACCLGRVLSGEGPGFGLRRDSLHS